VKNFGDLASTLADLATSLCASSVRVTKRVDEDGRRQLRRPGRRWTFTGDLEVSSGSYDWRQPAGSTKQRHVTVTNDNPTAMFEWDPQNAGASATFTFSESARLGYRFVTRLRRPGRHA